MRHDTGTCGYCGYQSGSTTDLTETVSLQALCDGIPPVGVAYMANKSLPWLTSLRQRHGIKRHILRPKDKARLEAIADRLRAGVSITVIGKEFGITRAAVSLIGIRLGIKPVFNTVKRLKHLFPCVVTSACTTCKKEFVQNMTRLSQPLRGRCAPGCRPTVYHGIHCERCGTHDQTMLRKAGKVNGRQKHRCVTCLRRIAKIYAHRYRTKRVRQPRPKHFTRSDVYQRLEMKRYVAERYLKDNQD